MFINKFNNQPTFSTQRMSSYINIFLKTEITCIPKFLTSIFGEYYNNALCNGATWVFFLWCILHAIFDKCLGVFLKRLRYREYVRSRLKSSLWYLGFYGTALVYCSAILVQNDISFFTIKKLRLVWNNPNSLANIVVPIPLVLGHTVISTFYLHSAVWEGFIRESYMNMLNYLLLFIFTVISYMSRIPEIFEISLKLTAAISAAQLALEFTRCIFMSFMQEGFLSKLIAAFVFSGTLFSYIVIYLNIVPLISIVKLGLSIMSDNPHVLSVFLFFNLLAWLGTDIYCSVLFRFVNHWLYHQKESTSSLKGSVDSLDKTDEVVNCDNTLFECSLFKPRDDLAYHIRRLRNEIQERRNKAMAMRKPKNVLFHTLKCMVAIKRKLSEKRLSEMSDSESKDSDSDKSENNESKSSDNTDDEAADVNSEESDGEFEKEKVGDDLKKESKTLPDSKNSSSEMEEGDIESSSSEGSVGDNESDEEEVMCNSPENRVKSEQILLETEDTSTIDSSTLVEGKKKNDKNGK